MKDNKTSRAPESQKGHQIEPAKKTDGIGAEISIEINDKKMTVPYGTTILDACKENQIHIPTLCHHDDLCVAGVCRVCLVAVEGMRTLQASCAYPITSPMKIHTSTPEVRKARRHVVDLLLSEHHGECYACVRNNNCELQSLAKEYGVDKFTFGHVKEPQHEIDASSFSVVRDMDKCVLCKRCVRTCIDLQEVGVLESINKGRQK